MKRTIKRGLEMFGWPYALSQATKPKEMNRRDFLATALGASIATICTTGAYAYNTERSNLSKLERFGNELDTQVYQLNEELEIKNAHIQRIREEEQEQYDQIQAELRESYEFEKTARETPSEIPFGYSETVDLARLLIAEGGEFHYNDEKLGWFSDTVLRRAELAKVSVEEVIFDATTYPSGEVVHRYSCFNSGNPMRPKVQNPLAAKNATEAKLNKEAWLNCYAHAKEALNRGKPLRKVDHYWTDSLAEKPYWAEGEQPIGIVSGNGKNTRFYALNKFAPAGVSPLIKNIKID